ncbi:hypothetical protein Adt_31728 [Abeliophyllum distichum]|uniref:Uncharacterized protein n=1 Tax=Abeliophyllum distichum TaxID=126358 RepID=A0ABD1REX7_9LAMI
MMDSYLNKISKYSLDSAAAATVTLVVVVVVGVVVVEVLNRCFLGVMSSQTPEKASKISWILRSNPMVQWGFKLLMLVVFLGILIVWGIDGLGVNTVKRGFVVLKSNSSETWSQAHGDFSFNNLSIEPQLEKPNQENQNNLSLAQTHENLGHKIAPAPVNLDKNQQNVSTLSSFYPNSTSEGMNSPSEPRILDWITSELEANYTSKLLANWLVPGGEPCRDSKTVDITIPGLDGHDNIEISAGDIHEFVFQALDDSGKPRCLGGDYFETDLSGESWKARPPVKDFGNGTYGFSIQVHPDFLGDYNLTIILLFRHYEGLKFSPERFAVDRVLRVIPIKFKKVLCQITGNNTMQEV